MTTSFLPAGTFTGLRLDRVLDDSECAALVERIEAGFVPTGRAYPPGYRNNDRVVLDDPALAAALYLRVRAALPAELIIDGQRWCIDGLNPRFRACRYAGGQSFCIHRDGPYAPGDGERSWLTLQIYLDDGRDFAGGRTRFYADPAGTETWATIAPVRGTAIAFDHRAWHDGEAVTAGEKRVVRSDVMYRRVEAALATDPTLVGRHRGYGWRVIARRDGTLASSGRDGTVRLWSATGSDAVVHDLHAGSVTALAEDGRGRLWCGTRGGALFVIDGAPRRAGAVDGAVLDLAAVDDGVVAALSTGQVAAWTDRGPSWSTAAHDGWAWSVARGRDGIVSCGEDGRLVTITGDGAIATVDTRPGALRAVALSSSGAILAGDGDGHVHVAGRRLTAHRAAVTALATGPGDRWVSAGEDGLVQLWLGVTRIAAWRAADAVRSVLMTGDRIAWTGYDGAVRSVPADTAVHCP